MSAEAEVVQKTHQFLKSHPLADQSVLRLYTDAHTTLLPHKTLSPFQRLTLDLGDFVMHPDLVGQLTDGATICIKSCHSKVPKTPIFRDFTEGFTVAEGAY